MARNTAMIVVLGLGVAGAGGFFIWKKLRKHDVVMSAQGASCTGPVTVEETVYQDGNAIVKKEHKMNGATWTSRHSHPAGTQYSVLARGGCKELSCRILVEGEDGGSGRTESDQVSCTAMVGK